MLKSGVDHFFCVYVLAIRLSGEMGIIFRIICDNQCMDKVDLRKNDFLSIQKRLREAIAQSGMTQVEIAEKLGISSKTISKYMRQNIFPSLDTFARLCVIIDASADEILGIN